VLAALIILGAIVVALSTFTDATKNLLQLVVTEARPDVNGEWQAEVTYDWTSRTFTETFNIQGDGDEVYGTASFLGVKRGIVEGQTKKEGLQFITITAEVSGSQSAAELKHEYRGKLLNGEIKFTMQTWGGSSAKEPLEFIARKIPTQTN